MIRDRNTVYSFLLLSVEFFPSLDTFSKTVHGGQWRMEGEDREERWQTMIIYGDDRTFNIVAGWRLDFVRSGVRWWVEMMVDKKDENGGGWKERW